MLAALEEHFPAEARWTRPDGGFFVWVELPPYVDCSTMLAEAVEYGVTYAPGDGFFPDGRGKNCMRLAFCYAAPEAITEGIRRLAEVVEDRLELYRAFIAAGALPDREGRGGMKEKIAVLMGGRSLEREVSLASGRSVCDALDVGRLLRAAARRDRRPRGDAAERAPGRRLHRAARQVRRGRHHPGAARVPRHPVHRAGRGLLRAVVGQVRHQAPLRREGHPHARVGHAHLRRVQGDGRGDRARPGGRSRRRLPGRGQAGSAGLGARPDGASTRPRASPTRCSRRCRFDTSALVEKWVEGTELAVSVLGRGPGHPRAARGRDRRRRRGSTTSRRVPRRGRPTSSRLRASRPRPPRRWRASPARCTSRSAAAT